MINYFMFELQVRPIHQMGRARRRKRRGRRMSLRNGRRMSLRKRLTLSNVLPSRSGCVCVCVCVCCIVLSVCLLALNVRVCQCVCPCVWGEFGLGFRV